MRLSPLVALLVTAAASLPAAAAVAPTLTVNGVSGPNGAIVPLAPFEPLSIAVDGPPGAPFAIHVSIGVDATVETGWFLRPVAVDTVFVPVHPVFDGIGSETIESGLGLADGELVASDPAPFFRLGAGGSFALHGTVPPVALFRDLDPATAPGLPYGPSTPVVLPLSAEIELHLQVVAIDPADGAFEVGNGVTLAFGPPRHPAVVTHAEAVGAPAGTLAERLTVGTLVSDDLGGGTLPSFDPAAGFASSALDVWAIRLAGPSELVDRSAPPGLSADALLGALHAEAPEPEFRTGVRPAFDGENLEFPRLRLPGGRQLLHWRDGAVTPPAYGFALVDETSGAVTNLVPASFGDFRGTATRSPWEVEVAVSPSGDRALVILDESTAVHDRAFLLRLEPGGAFPNGLPIVEVTPAGGVGFGAAFESGATFLADSAGADWIAIPASTDPQASEAAYPDRLHLAPADGSSALGAVFPTSTTPGIDRIDRTLLTSLDRRTACFVAGTSETNENVFALTDLTPAGAVTFTNLTGFVGQRLGESTDVTDGSPKVTALSADGSRFAGVREVGGLSIPFAVTTDGGRFGAVPDLVADVSSGGEFDLDHFPFSNGLFLTDDGTRLLFHQGLAKSFLSDACDQFVVDVTTGATENLTRTISGPGYDGNLSARLLGPWSPATADDRPTVGYGGSFLGPDRRWRFFFRDLHELLPTDRLDLYAVSIGDDVTGEPSLALVNVTGDTFEPSPGVAPPPGAPSIRTDAGLFQEQTPDFYRVRRIGGGGVFESLYLLTARLTDAPPGEQSIESLFLFDGANPSAAARLTAFSPTSSPIAVGPQTRIRSVTPNPVDGRIVCVLDLDGSRETADQELIQIDLSTFGAISRLPVGPIAYDRAIAAGSLAWLPSTPAGLVWVEGTAPRPAATTDGLATAASVDLPIDGNAWFLDLSDPTVPWPLRADGGAPRLVFPLAVR